MNDQEKKELRSLVFKAWDETAACPDDAYGGEFCPSCFFQTLYKLLTESQTND